MIKARIIGTSTIIEVSPYFVDKRMIGYGEKSKDGKSEVERYWPPSALQIIDHYQISRKTERDLKFSAAAAYMSLECSREGVKNKYQYEQIALKAIDIADTLIGVLRKRGEL